MTHHLSIQFRCKPNVVVVLEFKVPPTAKVIRRWDFGLKSHKKDWRSPGSNPSLQGEWLHHYTTEVSVNLMCKI